MEYHPKKAWRLAAPLPSPHPGHSLAVVNLGQLQPGSALAARQVRLGNQGRCWESIGKLPWTKNFGSWNHRFYRRLDWKIAKISLNPRFSFLRDLTQVLCVFWASWILWLTSASPKLLTTDALSSLPHRWPVFPAERQWPLPCRGSGGGSNVLRRFCKMCLEEKLVWFVVWTPLKNMSQLGWLFPIYGKIKNGNQTTNQSSSQGHNKDISEWFSLKIV